MLATARLALLIGPSVLAFFAGGYFPEAQAWAALGAWLLVALAALLEPDALPRSRAAWVALGGLGLWAAWSLASMAWAPVAGSAYHAAQLVFLYVGGLLGAVMLLRDRGARRLVEPLLAFGATVVIGYGISERLLPGLLHFARTPAAMGRLEQPLTYWNAMGELAALGLVLCARMVGDATRPLAVRLLAAAASAPLGMGLYISFSRGALFAWVAGLVTLLVAAPRREQLRGLLVGSAAAVLAAAASAPFKGVTGLAGSLARREHQGAAVFVLLIGIALAAALVQWQLQRSERTQALRLPRRARWLALAAICAGLAVAIVAGAKEGSGRPLSGGAGRLVTFSSNRYAYWRVAGRAFLAEPIRGVGAGGWAVWWLRYRSVDEFAQDAHSLPLQTAAELGLVGLVLLAAFAAGLVLAARQAHRGDWALAAGPLAGLACYAAHAPLDWDWQMPAVTLVAIALAGLLLRQADLTTPRRSAAPLA